MQEKISILNLQLNQTYNEYYLNYGIGNSAEETSIATNSEYKLFNVELYQSG